MIKEVETAVLIIGSGGAGLRTAIELHDNKVDVTVVGKCKKRDAHTILATGGINASLGNMDSEDTWEQHAADTIRDGGLINDPMAVETLCKLAPDAVNELVNWKTNFHREKNGKISQRFFGAATYRRACFIGDYTGQAILNTLVDQVNKRNINFQSEIYIFSILKNKMISGALGLNIKTGNIIYYKCKVIVLATGGHSRMYKRSSSRFWENNGDGIGLALNLGAKFMDMEMFQFHPSGMVSPEIAEGMLVTEAVRGEGGILTNIKGERFMEKYDKERLELSARDVVARAIYHEVKEGRGTKKGGVYLDISSKSKSYIKMRIPRMYKQFQTYLGVDISKDKMEVAPTAHYSMGGICVNHKTGETDVPGLFAVGEVTSGVHGGNRLGGNSLAEILVYGKLTGKYLTDYVKKINIETGNISVSTFDEIYSKSGKNPIKIKEEIQQLMWRYVGVIRNAKDMKIALKKLQKYKNIKFNFSKSMKMNEKLIASLDVKFMIPTCEMIIRSALMRKESRAAHYRTDNPKLDPKWRKNIICYFKNNSIVLETKNIKPIPGYIQRLMNTKVSRKLVE